MPEYVVKAQILAGGRGKGHFDTGFKGGVHITTKYFIFFFLLITQLFLDKKIYFIYCILSSDEVMQLVDKMVGHKLITKQVN